MLPLRCEAERGEGDPLVRFAITDAGIDLIVFGMVSHHFATLHPLLGTLAEALEPERLDEYIMYERGAENAFDPARLVEVRETLCAPIFWMREHVEERLDYIRREDGMVQVNIPVPDFYWLIVAIEMMTPLFDPRAMQYDFLTGIVDKGQSLFTDYELMRGWSPDVDGGAIQ